MLNNEYFFQIGAILAQDSGADPNKSIFSTLILIPVMFIIMYFLVIRPQRKEEKKKKEMIANLKKGDSVLTTSGIYGKIVEFKDNNETVVLNIAQDTNVLFAASSVIKKK
ncbi:MAG: preprotein translocase subunit YajC [Leptospiraceae bacterium]|nr:preprotein translocase subunit YajC [Leptospiraceae bacterium]MCK6379770.1 preprotein translocase subunit YajC [Leptospiraceae bacterium]NUM41230.1 preprotein translocase subunit YajC [Leptospiraceae bacterium]